MLKKWITKIRTGKIKFIMKVIGSPAIVIEN